MTNINEYGDKLLSTSGCHGADIASQRMDELDKAAISFLLAAPDDRPACWDIGCGSGVQGMRFALLGAKSVLYDLVDIAGRVESFKMLFPACDLSFVCGDIMRTVPEDTDSALSLVYSQRTIHYLKFPDAVALTERFAKSLRTGGRVFLSASGLHSELGENYQDSGQPVEDRFAPLSREAARKHEIKEAVCLYEEADMHKLAAMAGLRAAEIWSSSFGNIKAIFEK